MSKRKKTQTLDCFYLRHRCTHKVTWFLNPEIYPEEMRSAVPSDVLWEQFIHAITQDLCPWCKGVAPRSEKAVSQSTNSPGPIVYIWQGWSQTNDALPGIAAPNPPPKD
jgi:hypothetical protein